MPLDVPEIDLGATSITLFPKDSAKIKIVPFREFPVSQDAEMDLRKFQMEPKNHNS
jgi:hypothetical protein